MKITHICAVAVLAASLVGVTGCSSSDDKPSSSGGYTDHSSPYPACNTIIQACHPYDVGEGEIHDCHDQGHEAKSDADCIPVKDHCLAVCAAGATDAGTDAATAQ